MSACAFNHWRAMKAAMPPITMARKSTTTLFVRMVATSLLAPSPFTADERNVERESFKSCSVADDLIAKGDRALYFLLCATVFLILCVRSPTRRAKAKPHPAG